MTQRAAAIQASENALRSTRSTSTQSQVTTKQILGVRFFSGSAAEAVNAGLRGGLVVVPSAPVLVDVASKPALREAVLGADLAIPDSGLMVLLWWLLTREKLERVSGLEYLKLLLQKLKPETPAVAKPMAGSSRRTASGEEGGGQTVDVRGLTSGSSGVFWIMPTEPARDRNLAWLRSQGFPTTVEDTYLAPMYPANGRLSDPALLDLVRKRRPAHIIIALGGGVQERLGWFLKQELEKQPGPATPLLSPENPGYVLKPASSSAVSGIHCIGAAIGFLSGEQVRIPRWVDYLYLGWLWRSVSAPRKFVPRYWKAARLVPLMIRYGAKAPGVADAET